MFFLIAQNQPVYAAGKILEESKIVITKTISDNPPVKPVRPPDEKAKKKKKVKKKLDKTTDSLDTLEFFFIIGIITLVLLFIGAFLFGFGVSILPVMIAGLIFIGLGNIVGALSSFFLVFSEDYSSIKGLTEFIAAIGVLIFTAGMTLLNLIVGLVFLIQGLIFSIPLLWGIGIALLVFFLIFLILTIIRLTTD